LAIVALYLDWDWQGAEKEFKHALELNPSYANAHHWYADYLAVMKRYDEALARKNLALKLEPLVPFLQAHAGLPYYQMRRYDDAIDQFQKALDLEPNLHAAHYYLSWAYINKNMYEDSIEEIKEAIRLSGQSSEYLGLLSYAYSLAGKKSDARRVLEQLNELEKDRFVNPSGFIFAHMGLGDQERAMEYLQNSVESRDYSSLPWHLEDKIFDDLRSNPRFQEIIRKLNLPQKEKLQP
jgi:tetratricopeptide (TPR) repeat protein